MPELFDLRQAKYGKELIDIVKNGVGESYIVETKAITGKAAVEKFTLTEMPNDKPVMMVINGVVYMENDAFTVDRSNVNAEVTWTFTEAADGFDISEDICTEVYFVSHKDKGSTTSSGPVSSGSKYSDDDIKDILDEAFGGENP